MTFARRIVNSVGWSAVETTGRHLAMFAVFVALARHLGPEAFGLAALAMVMPLILAAPVTKGIPEALIQRPEIDPLHLDSAFWLLVTVGAVLSAVTWFGADLIGKAFGEPLLGELVRWTCLVITIQAIAAVPTAILKRELRFRTFALRTLTGSITGGTVGIAMAISGFGVWSLVAMLIVQAATEAVVVLLGSRWRPQLRYSHAHCTQLYGFAAPIAVSGVWTILNSELPKIVLGSFLGPAAVGIYALARRPLELLSEVFLGPIIAIALPAVSRIQTDLTKVDHFFNASTRMAAIAGFAVFVGFAAVAPIAVPLVFGEHWSNAVVTVQILMVLGLVRTIDALCSLTIIALGHSLLIMKMNFVYTAIALVLLPIGAMFGLEGAMIALVACNALLVPVFLHMAASLARIDVMQPVAIYPRLVIAGALMFASVHTWLALAGQSLSQLAVLITGIMIGAVVYCSVLIAFVRPDIVEARRAFLSLNT